MAEKKSWVKIDRNILEWEWYRDSKTKALFLHLILKANIKEGRFRGVTIRRGQLATSYATLAHETGMSTQSVRTALNRLKSTGEVTSRVFHDFSILEVQNYDTYQTYFTDDSADGEENRKRGDGQQENARNRQKTRKKKTPAADTAKNSTPVQRPATAEPAEQRAWEVECGVPENFRGRFDSRESWLAFLND